MSPISEVASVQISIASSTVTQAGFGIPLIVGEADKLPDQDVWTITFSVPLITANSFTCKVNGDVIGPVVFSGDHATTMGLIETALEGHADIDTVDVVGNVLTVNGVINTQVTITEAAVTLGATQPTTTTVNTISLTRIRFYANLAAVVVDFATTDLEYLAASAIFSQNPSPQQLAIGRKDTGETWVNGLDAIVLENNTWFALIICERTEADVLLVAAWAKTAGKMFGTATQDPVTLTSGTGDLAAQLNTLAYNNTWVIFNESADGSITDEFADAAFFGDMLWRDPGSATWKFKTLTGVTPSVLTTTESTYALAKACNLYEEIHGQNMTRDGTVASEEFIDIIRGVMWLEMRMAERIFILLNTLPKVPFTDPGVQGVVNEVRAALNVGIEVGLLAANPAYTVTYPKVADVSTANKAARTLPDITFTATLAGAVHYVEVVGTVQV